MFKGRAIKILMMFRDIFIFFLRRRKALSLRQKSFLCDFEYQKRKYEKCPLCNNAQLSHLLDIPIGWPMPQNDHLLYFDYDTEDMEYIEKNRKFIERTLGFYVLLPWVFCSVCKNAILNLQFTERHLADYYSKYYKRLYPSSEKRQHTKERYGRYINSLIKKGAKLLELGTAEGYAAKYLAEEGHSVWAIEPSKFREQLLSNGGINVRGDINELEDNSFDCIYSHHVLEHILDVPGFLSKAYKLLKDTGILVIQVPDFSFQAGTYLQSLRFCHYSITSRFRYNEKIINNFSASNANSSYWMDALGNNHLYAFTPKGLEYILRDTTFNIRLIRQTTKDRLMFDGNIYSWPTDMENGQTPNGVTVVATK